MLQALIIWLSKSQGAKTAGAAASGSVLSVAVLMGALDKSVDAKIDNVNRQIIKYVDVKHNTVSNDISYMKEDISEIKDLLKTINERVYDLNKKER